MSVYPVSATQPDLTAIYIPEIWSAKLDEKFYIATIFQAIANTDWDGDIKDQGDTVDIMTMPTHNVHDYTKGQELVIDTLTSPVVKLLIDKGKYFSFIVEGVDKVQSSIPLMDKWGEGAAKDIDVAVDKEILAYIPGQVSATNKGITAGATSNYNLGTTGSAVGITTSNILGYFTKLATVLTESNVPADDRWVIVTPWMSNAIQNSDLKNASFSGMDESMLLKKGLIGSIAGLTVFESNNLTSVSDTDTCWNIVAGHKSALTFASQIKETRNMTDAKVWGDILQCLMVYGRKVVKPTATALLYCKDNTA